MNQIGQLNTRFVSIDVMRGITLMLMIIVNMSLSEELAYSQLLHSAWHGYTLTDAVFPTFLFVVGASLGIVIRKFDNLSNGAFISMVFKRALLIFICGFIVSNFPFFKIGPKGIEWYALADLRILGVLQRIGICYFFASIIAHYLNIRGAFIYCIIALLLNWWIFASFGDYSLENNAGLKLDKLILGASHLYKGEGIPFDPEGILGIIPSIANVLAGYIAARMISTKTLSKDFLLKLVFAGVGLLVLALFWNNWFPINKKIWTSSYALLNIAIDLLFLVGLVFLIEVKNHKGINYYFEVFGRNTLAIYIFAEILMSIFWFIPIGEKPLMYWVYDNSFAWIGGKLSGLVYAIIYMQACWCVAYILDKHKIYIKV